ncbi:F-box/WD repeat-containing protein 12-like isoform X4 [Acipenser ruthenus]|uniref:F-box/WD repeat-containing protein 12-like isoform X4 n=1 Tax=Acipenser ruthenus TaxID=7906 RepID=UPI00274264F9|nr:F-box/WD repeat-containing protein 12-like isoform X4 [Acipenser ruthenus]
MECDFPTLPLDCLVCIFSYLDAEDLITVSLVNQSWNGAAETAWLWRQLCMHRWTFCNLSKLNPEMKTWKNYYLRRAKLEQHMTSGRAFADYTCKTLRGHTGSVVGLVYLSDRNHQFDSKSIVCSASSDGTIRAWSIQEGIQLWSSQVQDAPLTKIIADQQTGLVISTDSQGRIKAWKAQTGDELASFPTASSACTLLTYYRKDQSFLTVYFTESLSCPCEDDPPVSASLPVNGCTAASFFPSEAARVMIVHSDGLSNAKNISIFDIKSKKSKYKTEIMVEQVGSFELLFDGWNSDILLEAHGSGTILIAQGKELKLYSIAGTQIASFLDHKEHIAAMCVDSFRVVTASYDLSLRVFTWKKEQNKDLSLESRYHLLGGSDMFSRFSCRALDFSFRCSWNPSFVFWQQRKKNVDVNATFYTQIYHFDNTIKFIKKLFRLYYFAVKPH